MTFDSIAHEAIQLSDAQQAKMLFYMLGKMDGFYKHDIEHNKCLPKQQALLMAEESLRAVK